MSSALLIVAGLAGLLIGADLLVRGGVALASHLGVRPIVIGLTVVALGTSLPELAIGIDAVRQGSPGLAVGNIVGATLVSILFILGLGALIRPIAFERRTLRFELQADCLAGVWMHSVYRRGELTDADLREALVAAAVVGDDFLRNAAGRQRPPEEWTHGSSAQRQRWLKTGFVEGRPGSCDTFTP